MKTYYVNKNAQTNGDHEVHIESCSHLPNDKNLILLGKYSNCDSAVQKSKEYYNQTNGCYYCCLPCHTS
ncbi:hypothetical protein LX95_01525 [Mesonia algae]|uniref:Uncharacterized protein n=1 Tax=Mesonia algae TaxID=213248 RepID=A0A2W7I4S9_9FLAO|nr:hypothetical protein [Mesonia algae]PZW40462.1 hypothetical protein LX95_01525 [Mesonia algae]